MRPARDVRLSVSSTSFGDLILFRQAWASVRVQQGAGDAFAVSEAGGDSSDSRWLLRRAFWSAEDSFPSSDESRLGRLDNECLTTAFDARVCRVSPLRCTGTEDPDMVPSRRAGGADDQPTRLESNRRQLVCFDNPFEIWFTGLRQQLTEALPRVMRTKIIHRCT